MAEGGHYGHGDAAVHERAPGGGRVIPVSDETANRLAAAIERLVVVIEARLAASEPRRAEPPARVIPKKGNRAA